MLFIFVDMEKYTFASRYKVGLKGGHDASSLILNINNCFEDYEEEDEYRDRITLRNSEREGSDAITVHDFKMRRSWRNKQLLAIKSELIGLCRCVGDYDLDKIESVLPKNVLEQSEKVEKKCLAQLKRSIKSS